MEKNLNLLVYCCIVVYFFFFVVAVFSCLGVCVCVSVFVCVYACKYRVHVSSFQLVCEEGSEDLEGFLK